MDDKEVLEDAHWKGWLNEKGLNAYIGYLKGEIIDLQPDIKEALSKGEPKRINQR